MKNFESPFLNYHNTFDYNYLQLTSAPKIFFTLAVAFFSVRGPCLGQRKSEGDARRWAWEHSVEMSF